MWESGDCFRAVREAEIALLTSDTRRHSGEVDGLLHADFVEIGRSGRRWARAETVSALEGEAPRETPETDEWLFSELAPGLVLVTYRLLSPTGQSRHSSIWDLRNGAPEIRFHQGTVVPE
jgi:ribonuclease HI